MKQLTVNVFLFFLIILLARPAIAQMEGTSIGGSDTAGASQFRMLTDKQLLEGLSTGSQSSPAWQSGTGNNFSVTSDSLNSLNGEDLAIEGGPKPKPSIGSGTTVVGPTPKPEGGRKIFDGGARFLDHKSGIIGGGPGSNP